MSERSERVQTVLKDSVPGDSNDEYLRMVRRTEGVVTGFIEETNNWFEIEKVHVYDDRIGITASWRWTIERWVAQDMDTWMSNHGWGIAPHLDADWHGRDEDEVEWRAKKEIDGVSVRANLLVEMTSRAIVALNRGEGFVKERKIKKDRIQEFLEEMEEDNDNGDEAMAAPEVPR